MATVKGFNALGGNITPPSPDKITLNITLNNIVNPTTKFADMKYNKRAGIILVSDDGYSSDFNAYKILHGGIDRSGVQHQGVRGTDGCGNQLEWHMTWALTGASRDVDTGQDRTLWSEYMETLPSGYGFSNHTKDHSGYDKYYEVKENEKYIFEKTGERTRTLVIPTADEGYSATAPSNSLRYTMVGSQFGLDSPDDFQNSVIYNGRVDVKTINQSMLNRLLLGRNFYVTWGDNDRLGIRSAMIDPVLNDSASGSSKYMGMIGMHGVETTPFITEVNYMRNHVNGGDNLWMPTMQEFTEYYELKLNATKNESLSGESTLIVEIDLSSLPKEGKIRDFSLLLEGANIVNVSHNGADRVTFNQSSGLINVFKTNQEVKNPYVEQTEGQTPPQIIDVRRTGARSVAITYDRPTTQTQFSNSNGNAYAVSNNVVSSVTGAGDTWTINCQSDISNGQVFDYRMQRGNARGLNGLSVCSYIGYPIP